MMDPQLIYEEFIARQKLYGSFGYDADESYSFVLRHVGVCAGSILEIGTGKGYFTLALAQRGLPVTSVDISSEDQEKAHALLRYFSLDKRVLFCHEDAGMLSFADATFDAVISVYLLHHLYAPYDVLSEMMRVVKPYGRIVIADFNKRGFILADEIHKARGQEQHPVSGINITDARDFFMTAGYQTNIFSDTFNDVLIASKEE